MLAELKIINCCPSRYLPDQQQKAVDRRASLLSNEYKKKAREVDRIAVGVGEGVQGPVERRLAEFGDVKVSWLGPWGRFQKISTIFSTAWHRTG